MCAGIGEWGTSGAAWYLAKHWRDLAKRFGKGDFAVVLKVTDGADESATAVAMASDPEELQNQVRSAGIPARQAP
jgi:GGDEF domain-containing protein